MLELVDLLRDWLSGDINVQIEDTQGDFDDGSYLLFNGTVNKAFQKFRKLEDKGIGYELDGYMEIDPSNGLLYIPVRQM